jgi:hypothetical protein
MTKMGRGGRGLLRGVARGNLRKPLGRQILRLGVDRFLERVVRDLTVPPAK